MPPWWPYPYLPVYSISSFCCGSPPCGWPPPVFWGVDVPTYTLGADAPTYTLGVDVGPGAPGRPGSSRVPRPRVPRRPRFL